MDDPQPPIERRIRAAMVLADLDYTALAKRINQRGLGERTLRKFTDPNDRREARPHELAPIAEACSVPYSFLSEGLGAKSDDRVEALEARLQAMERGSDALLAVVEATLDEIEDQFASRIEQRVSEALTLARDSLRREDHPGPA